MLGAQSNATGWKSVVVGVSSTASGTASAAIGDNTTVTQANAYVYGSAASATSPTTHGFGTATPSARIHVKSLGTTSATAGLKIDNSAGTNLLTMNDAGNVGIGTTAPSAGGTSANASRTYLTLKGTSGGGVMQVTSSAADADNTYIGGIEWVDSNSSQADTRSNYITSFTSGSTANNRGSMMAFATKADGTAGAAERMRITNSGDLMVGGTSSGVARLDGRGATADTTANAFNARNSLSTSLLLIRNDGNVGIGTTAPTARLNIKAGTAAAGTAPLKLTAGVLTTTPEDGAMEYAGSNLYYTIGATRYVIGTNSTAGSYSGVTSISNSGGSITMAPAASSGTVFINSGTTSTGTSSGALTVSGGVGVTGDIYAGATVRAGTSVYAPTSVYSPQIYGSTTAAGNIKIDGADNASKGNVLLASQGGSVGIGTTSPLSLLHVNGTATFGSEDYMAPQVQISKNAASGYTPSSGSTARPESALALSNGFFNDSNSALIAIHVRGLTSGEKYGYMGAVAGAATNAPALVFGGSTGMTSYAEAMRIQSGNIGVGTTDPSLGLALNANARYLTVAGSGSSSAASYGTLGLGNNRATPSATDFLGALNFISSGAPINNRVGGQIAAQNEGAGGANGFGTNLQFTTKADNGTATERLRIAANGNVGIGTTAPGAKLDVAMVVTSTSGNITSSSGYIEANPTASSSANYQNYFGVGVTTGNSNNLTGEMTGTYSEVWHDGTGVLSSAVGVSGDVTKFSSGPITTAYGLYSYIGNLNSTGSISTGYGLYIDFFNRTGPITNSYGVYVADPVAKNYFAGNVGIGTSVPGAKLEVNSGAANAATGVTINTTSVGANTYEQYKANGTVIGSITSAAGANVAFNTTSDVRLKGGFQEVASPLKTLNEIEVANFYYLLDPTHRQDGFKAQQLYEVLPYAVTKPEHDVDAEGKLVPWLADYSKVVPVVTAAVQELYKRLVGVETHQTMQDRSIASVESRKADKTELAVNQAEVHQLRVANAALQADVTSMKAEAAALKAETRAMKAQLQILLRASKTR